VNINCEFAKGAFSHSIMDSSTYYCRAKNLNIDSIASIDEISGNHLSGTNNDDIKGFVVKDGNVHYFLQGLEKHFKNLKSISYWGSHLKEIHQSDLKPFPKLIDLMLHSVDLEYIEEDLFLYNTDLVYIYMNNNKIFYIHPNVFDNLNKLTKLVLTSNTCVNKAGETSTELKELFQLIKSNCQSPELLSLDEDLTNLETNANSLNSILFKEKLEALNKTINESKFSNYSTFKERLAKLEEQKLKENIVQDNCFKTDLTEADPTTSGDCVHELKRIENDFKSAEFEMFRRMDIITQKVDSLADVLETLKENLGKISKALSIEL